MSAGPLYNPFAPPVFNGFPDDSPEGYADVDFSYIYDTNPALGPLETRLNQAVSTMNDADFAIRGMYVSQATGAFSIRISDSQGYYLSNGPIVSSNILGDASSPFVVWPEILIPAAGRIGIDIADLSGALNTIEVVFRGVKRYRIAR